MTRSGRDCIGNVTLSVGYSVCCKEGLSQGVFVLRGCPHAALTSLTAHNSAADADADAGSRCYRSSRRTVFIKPTHIIEYAA